MAVTDFVWARQPLGIVELTVTNTDSVDFVAGDCVKPDPTNSIGTTVFVSGSVQPNIGALRTTTDDAPMGVVVESIPQGKSGRVMVYGVAVGRQGAAGAITAGQYLQCDTVGNLKTQGAGKPCIGMALSTTASTADPVLVLITHAKEA